MRPFGAVLAIAAACWAAPASAQRFVAVGASGDPAPADPLGTRQPAAGELAQASAALRRYFAMPPRPMRGSGYWEEASRQNIARTLDDYIVQVASIYRQPAETSAAGERQRDIYMQGVCSEAAKNMNLERGLSIVADGGDCFFHARYDPASDSITSFYGGGN